jgi:hypothetical protein
MAIPLGRPVRLDQHRQARISLVAARRRALWALGFLVPESAIAHRNSERFEHGASPWFPRLRMRGVPFARAGRVGVATGPGRRGQVFRGRPAPPLPGLAPAAVVAPLVGALTIAEIAGEPDNLALDVRRLQAEFRRVVSLPLVRFPVWWKMGRRLSLASSDAGRSVSFFQRRWR